MTTRLLGLPLVPLLAMSSPWWEDYAIKETYLCPNRGRVLLERNDAQASLISRGARITYFRVSTALSGIRYRNQRQTLILRGDILTLEQLPNRIDCTRTEQV